MAWQDDIAEQRRVLGQEKAAQALHKENIEAVKGGSGEVVGATASLAKTKDIDSLIAEVKEVQLASLLGASKPSVVLTDQTDLGDKMGELADKVQAAILSVDTTDTNKQQLAELKSLYVGLTQLKTAFTTGNSDLSKAIKALTKTVQALDVNPVVNVPPATVKVDAPKLDLQPLQDTLKQYFASSDDDIDLDCYKAQDISESGGKQYVGFVNLQGGWYIIENDIKGNSLRYLFGTGNYAKTFKKAATYQYSLLNEAINALTA